MDGRHSKSCVTTSKEATSRKVVFPPGEVLRPQYDFIGMRFQSRRHKIIHRLTCSQLKTGSTEYDQRPSEFAFLSGSSSFHLAIDHRREFNLAYAELSKAARSVGVWEFGGMCLYLYRRCIGVQKGICISVQRETRVLSSLRLN